MNGYTILNIRITYPFAMLLNSNSDIYFFAGSFLQQYLPLAFRYTDYWFVILNKNVIIFLSAS